MAPGGERYGREGRSLPCGPWDGGEMLRLIPPFLGVSGAGRGGRRSPTSAGTARCAASTFVPPSPLRVTSKSTDSTRIHFSPQIPGRSCFSQHVSSFVKGFCLVLLGFFGGWHLFCLFSHSWLGFFGLFCVFSRGSIITALITFKSKAL